MVGLSKLYIELRHFPPNSRNSYLLATALVAAMTLLRVEVGSAITGTPFLTLFPTLLVMTLLCGVEVGSYSAALATLCAWYFLLPPIFSFKLDPRQIPALLAFVVFASLGIVIIGALRAAIERGRRLNETLAMAFEANPDAILLTDRSGRIVKANQRAASMFGKSREAMIGAAIETLLPERLRGHHVRHRDGFMADSHLRGMGVGRELLGRHNDGTEFPVDVLIGPIELHGEAIAIATVRDLTEQNALAAALAESRQQHAVLQERARSEEELRLWADAFKCAGIGIAIYDPLTGIVRFVNPAYAADRGMTVEECQGRRMFDGFAAEERPRLPALLAAADRDGRVVFEAHELRKDGTTFLAQKDIVSVRSAEGVLLYRVASSHDISEARRTEETLRHTQRMEAIGRLSAGVAHDFNNVLHSIFGALELVLDEVPAHLQAHEFANLALKAAQRGASLTRHLLAYARKQVLAPQAIDLSAFLSDIKVLMARSLGAHILIDLRVDPTTPPVFADQGLLQTAVLNLAINASHAMPAGGRLLLAASAQPDDVGRWVLLTVTDTGTGMDAATLARAIDPFFTTKGLDGSGLGLSMVNGFAEQSHGSMRLSSQLGIGTTVELRLPVAEAAAETLADPVAQTTLDRSAISGRILLVDDAADTLITTSAFLSKAGFEVVRAHDGDAALAILAHGPRFHAMVTDFAMPGMNGVDLITESRQIQPGLPALIITGFAEVKGQSVLPTGVPVLHKPLSRLDLLHALKRLLVVAPAENAAMR
jgi:PAS domain S-box-containing protein